MVSSRWQNVGFVFPKYVARIRFQEAVQPSPEIGQGGKGAGDMDEITFPSYNIE